MPDAATPPPLPAPPPTPLPTPLATPGAYLRACREKAGLTLEGAALRFLLTSAVGAGVAAFLVAIEADLQPIDRAIALALEEAVGADPRTLAQLLAIGEGAAPVAAPAERSMNTDRATDKPAPGLA